MLLYARTTSSTCHADLEMERDCTPGASSKFTWYHTVVFERLS